MAPWKVPALFLLLAVLVSAPAMASDTRSASDAGVVSIDAKVAPSTQPSNPDIPATVDEAVDAAQSVFSDFKSEKWRAGIAGIITLLVFAWRRFLSGFIIGKLPNGALPFVTAGVAFLAAIPVTLSADPWSWKTFLWQGLVTGAQAMAFWSLCGKFILGKITKSNEKPEEENHA